MDPSLYIIASGIADIENVLYSLPGRTIDLGPTGYVMDYEYEGFEEAVDYQINWCNNMIVEISGILTTAESQLNAVEAGLLFH